jgi:predicted nuclease of predicted toxin-antitoxin system
MKFLADENVEKHLVDFLRNEGHDVLYVPEMTRRSVDEKLLERANSESRILITNDKDFGELVYFQKKVTSGILLMRFVSEKSSFKIRFLKAVLKDYGHRLISAFTVVSESKVRIRPLR